LITLEGLTVRYGRTIALHRVDVTLEPGIIGMFGPNGSGKSTLLRAVAGLLRPVAGRVTYNGREVNAADETWRRCVGYAGHQPGLYEELTVRENLKLFAHLNGADPRAVEDTLERIGLAERADDRVSSLSAGMRRRAGVARALVHDPKVLLLDEPYANLDDESADRISALIKERSGRDRTAVIATHGARRLKAFADHGLVLRQGTVATFRPYEHA
jgi:heme exporter protein A